MRGCTRDTCNPQADDPASRPLQPPHAAAGRFGGPQVGVLPHATSQAFDLDGWRTWYPPYFEGVSSVCCLALVQYRGRGDHPRPTGTPAGQQGPEHPGERGAALCVRDPASPEWFTCLGAFWAKGVRPYHRMPPQAARNGWGSRCLPTGLLCLPRTGKPGLDPPCQDPHVGIQGVPGTLEGARGTGGF